ncbi:MAG: asparagine synthase, partial [Rhodothermales bacterium]|nr:asparagine synthase [Rhodothermales bacterium]
HVKVVLGGEGADELFGGYRRYRRNLLAEALGPAGRRFHHRVPAPLFGEERRRALLGKAYVPARDLPSEGRIRDDVRQFAVAGPINAALQADMRSWLPDNLLAKVDGMSMMASLEARVPYLDPEVAAMAFRFSGRDKVGLFRLKKLLRDVANKEIPDSILTRPKSGFTVPVNEWFQASLGHRFREIVLCGSSADSWLQTDVAEKLLLSHQRTGRSGLELWSILVFSWWVELNT